MSLPYLIDVTAGGTVLLGPDVSCDGFHYSCPVRVQSHVHRDHMAEFETSKGNQDLVMSEATRDLLITEYNADLPYRQNLVTLGPGEPLTVRESRVMLSPSHHMLGAVQVCVEHDGYRFAYSGDFQWPLDEVPEVDALVVDSTYGSPDSCPRHPPGLAEEKLVDLVACRLRHGPVEIFAFRGTLHRALQALAGNVDCTFVGSPELERELEVYRRYGYAIEPLEVLEVPGEKCIHFYGNRDAKPVSPNGTTIRLSAFGAREDDPVLTISDQAYRVALSDHADFDGTLEYIRASGAKFVVTDNSRGQGVQLAREINARLGVEARPSSGEHHRGWGET
jgi:putative mRNA 3-end processing factor